MNKITKIHTDSAPAAVGPYSQAIATGGMLYTSGQIALDPATGEIVGDDHQGSGRAGDEEPGSRSGRSWNIPGKCDKDHMLP